MKKADLSINTIIIAVIAILVLVVLVLIFTGKIKWFNTVTGDCENNLKGDCVPKAQCDGQSLGQMDCGVNNVCCKNLGT